MHVGVVVATVRGAQPKIEHGVAAREGAGSGWPTQGRGVARRVHLSLVVGGLLISDLLSLLGLTVVLLQPTL